MITLSFSNLIEEKKTKQNIYIDVIFYSMSLYGQTQKPKANFSFSFFLKEKKRFQTCIKYR